MADNKKTDRREFLNTILGGSVVAWLASIIYPVVRFVSPPHEMEAGASSEKIARVDDIPLNTGKIFKFGNKPVIVIRKTNGELTACYAKCTHLDCIVQYRPDMQRIWCACHNGQYDLNGVNVAGPPPRPLEQLDVKVADNDIYVTRKA